MRSDLYRTLVAGLGDEGDMERMRRLPRLATWCGMPGVVMRAIPGGLSPHCMLGKFSMISPELSSPELFGTPLR